MNEALSERSEQMREEFDASFADLPGRVVVDQDDVLLLSVGGQERAILLSEVAGVIVRPPITAVPTRNPAMIGIVSDRGTVAAAWDLGRLLGLPAQNPHWLLVPLAETGVAITFENFIGFRRVASSELDAQQLLPLPDLVRSIREQCANPEA